MTHREFENNIDLYANRLTRFAYKLVSDKDQAKDIVQEAFTKLWENRSKIALDKTKSWLFTVTYRESIAWLKKQNKMVYDLEKDIEPFEINTNDLKSVLTTSLELLSDTQKTALLLRDYEGYSYQEIGEIMELNESQVKVYLFRARLKIKNYIKDKDLVN